MKTFNCAIFFAFVVPALANAASNGICFGKITSGFSSGYEMLSRNESLLKFEFERSDAADLRVRHAGQVTNIACGIAEAGEIPFESSMDVSSKLSFYSVCGFSNEESALLEPGDDRLSLLNKLYLLTSYSEFRNRTHGPVGCEATAFSEGSRYFVRIESKNARQEVTVTSRRKAELLSGAIGLICDDSEANQKNFCDRARTYIQENDLVERLKLE